MKMMKRISAFLLALLFVLLASSCNESKTPQENTTQTEESTEPESSAPSVTDSVKIVANGKPAVTVIRGDNSTEMETQAMTSIAAAIEKACGQAPDIQTDFYAKAKGISTEYIILVGNTEFEESTNAASGMEYGDYRVSICGNAVVVSAFTNEGFVRASESLIGMIESKAKTDKTDITLKKDDEKSGLALRNGICSVPTLKGAFPIVSEISDLSAYQFLYTKLTDELVETYQNDLIADGFLKLSEREVAHYRYFTYRRESSKSAITLQYDYTDHSLRVLLGNTDNQYVQDENRYTVTTTPQLMMMGDTFDSQNNLSGLECMMIRLSDGRFIMIDGGVATKGFADKIYNTMVEASGGKTNVTVAAWFFSHSHNDHIGGFNAICQYYSSKVNIEAFYYNFTQYDIAKTIDSGAANDAQKTYNNIVKFYPNANIYKCRMGEVYHIADAKAEVWYTADEYLTGTRSLKNTKNFNETSLIFSVDIAGQRIMFLGDAQNINNNETANRFGSLLKSDIVQVAHHGGVGGTASIYQAINAQVALITTDDSRVESFMSTSFNQAMLNNPNMKEWFNVHNRVYVWDLPYTPTGTGLQP